MEGKYKENWKEAKEKKKTTNNNFKKNRMNKSSSGRRSTPHYIHSNMKKSAVSNRSNCVYVKIKKWLFER